jgi:hypothetical protein
MHDLRENNKLRTQQPYFGVSGDGYSATISPNAVRLDVHYMLTAWAADPNDEHRLLGRTLMVLYRHHILPEEFLSGMLSIPGHQVLLKVAQYDQRDIRREIWSMLDNEMRPIVDLTATLAIEPFESWTEPLVRSVDMAFGQYAPARLQETEGSFASGVFAPDRFYTVAGTIHGGPFDYLSVQLLELAVPVSVSPSGLYSIHNLRSGDYTLVVETEGRQVHHPITVPSPAVEYDVNL